MPWESVSTFTLTSFAPIARGHEIARELATNENLITALGELAASPALRDQAAADPLAFAISSGVTLPKGSVIAVRRYNQVWEVEITVEEGGYTYTNGFNSSRGFYHR